MITAWYTDMFLLLPVNAIGAEMEMEAFHEACVRAARQQQSPPPPRSEEQSEHQ